MVVLKFYVHMLFCVTSPEDACHQHNSVNILCINDYMYGSMKRAF